MRRRLVVYKVGIAETQALAPSLSSIWVGLVGMKSRLGFGRNSCFSRYIFSQLLARRKLCSEFRVTLVGLLRISSAVWLSVESVALTSPTLKAGLDGTFIHILGSRVTHLQGTDLKPTRLHRCCSRNDRIRRHSQDR